MQQYGPSHHLADDGLGAPPRLKRLLHQSLRAIAEQVACTDAGLWLFDSGEGADSLRCLACYDAGRDRVEDGPGHDIGAGGRALFEALSCEAHVLDDSSSGALRGLAPTGRTGGGAPLPGPRMACAFSLNGRLLGVVICARPSMGADWSQRQRVVLTRAGASLALSLSRDGEAAFSALVERLPDTAP